MLGPLLRIAGSPDGPTWWLVHGWPEHPQGRSLDGLATLFTGDGGPVTRRGLLIVCLPSYPPLTRLSRESGDPYVLDVGLPLDKTKVHGKIGVVAKTKTPWVTPRCWLTRG